MMIVADSSPLIFLGKIGHLDLIARLFPGPVLVPGAVWGEVLAAPVAPNEEHELVPFLASCRRVRVVNPRHFAEALSEADNQALTLAIRRRADLLLADDRLLRRMAEAEGVRPMGTLGILLRALEKAVLTRFQTRQALEALIQHHQYRISIEVYDAALQRIESHRRHR